MKGSFFIIILLFSLGVSAVEDHEKVFVHALDEELDLAPLSDEDFVKIQGAGEATNQTYNLPDPKELDKNFETAGMKDDVKDFDQVSKDIFVSKLLKRSISSVAEDYPQFSKDKLEKLKASLGGK